MRNKLIIVLLLIVATASGVMAATPSDNLGFIQVDVKFLDTLNLNHDKSTKFIIEIPHEYKGKVIDPKTVTVNGFHAAAVPTCTDCHSKSGPGNDALEVLDGSEEVHQAFVVDLLGSINCADQVELIVGGSFTDRTRFEKHSFIRVIDCKKRK